MTNRMVSLLTLFLLMGSSAVWGQRGRGVPPADARTVEEQLSRMKESLDLTDEQEAKIRPILEESRERMTALRQKYRGSSRSRSTMQALRSEMETLRRQREEKLQAVLSEQQMNAYRELLEERRGPGGRRR